MESVKLWVEYIKEYCPNPNARIILPLNWAYTDSDNFEADTKELYQSYKEVEQKFGVAISPVGEAYKMILDKDGVNAKNSLYTDNRHPSVLVSYLAACTLYGTLMMEEVLLMMDYLLVTSKKEHIPSPLTTEKKPKMQYYIL